MADLFAISNAVIDEGKTIADVGPINRINHQLSELGDGIAIVDAFARAEVYQKRRDGETSLMAKAIFGDAANESSAQLEKE